jgi:hypothetical protein
MEWAAEKLGEKKAFQFSGLAEVLALLMQVAFHQFC